MPSVRLLAGAVALALATSTCPVQAATPTAIASPAADRAADAVWIVMFEGAPLARQAGELAAKAGGPAGLEAAKAAYRGTLAQSRARRLAQAEALLGRSLDPLFTYEHASNGVALRLGEDEARTLASIPGVRRVSRDRAYQLQTDKGPAFIGAPAIWNGTAGVASRGEGIVIGVIDSGINTSHPSFAQVGPEDNFVHANPRGQRYGLCAGGAGGCNDKLIGIYDFTQEGARDGRDVDGHGSHVASIAAGNHLRYTSGSQQIEISGVAPHAAIISYKVCIADDPDTEEEEDECLGSAIMEALDQATADQVDVINYSIGGGGDDPWVCFGVDCGIDGVAIDTPAEAFLAARAAGIVSVTSAGNNGPDPMTVTAPGFAPWLITVAAASHDRSPGQAGLIASFSSRGPALLGGTLLPDVTAPGVSIIAADGDSTNAVGMSGTSMASPHVAGAAALLLGAHPDWGVDEVATALIGTARPDGLQADLATPATLWEQGAGIVDLAKAVRSGLSMPVSAAEYEEANPAIGGVPSGLNEPALVVDPCFATCTVTRTVEDLVGGGSWRVVADTTGGLSVSATPGEFTLAAGARQAITFALDASAVAGEWSYGEVRIEPVAGTPAGTPALRLPLAVFADPGDLPEAIEIEAATDAGFVDIALDGIVALPQASFATTGMGEADSITRTLREDPTNGDPYDGVAGELDGAFQHRILHPANGGRRTLVARTSSATSEDVDLFVGIDTNQDGLPSEGEEQCRSTSPDETEECVLDVFSLPQDFTYWVLVQNWSAGNSGADAVTLETVLYDDDANGDGALTVTGPGHTASSEPFTIRIAWEDFTLTSGAIRAGELLLGTTPDRLGITARIPLVLRRSAATTTAPQALQPGVALPVRLPAGAAEDRLYLDVPANASSMTVTLAGAGEVDVFAAHAADAGGPVIAPAPAREAAAARSSAAGGNDTLTVSGSQLAPGRWYLTPVNTGSAEADFTLQVELAYDAARAPTRGGAFYNPERSGAGGFLYPAGGAWAFIWYTFLQDGTPAWYLGAAPAPGAQQGTVVIPLDRYTWDGDNATAHRVGEAVLSLVDTGSFRFSWNLDGESGSELYRFIDGGGCPTVEPNDLTGSWYAPALSGYGYSVNAYQVLESNAAYFYDGQGVGRWAFGSAAPFGADTIVLSQFSGSGPLQPYVAPTTVEVGSYTRRYDSETSGHATLDVELAPPLSGSWTTENDISKLTDALGCD